MPTGNRNAEMMDAANQQARSRRAIEDHEEDTFNESDKFGRYGALDRTAVIMVQVDANIIDHTGLMDDERTLAQKAYAALFELYQLLGERVLGDDDPGERSDDCVSLQALLDDIQERQTKERSIGDDQMLRYASMYISSVLKRKADG